MGPFGNLRRITGKKVVNFANFFKKNCFLKFFLISLKNCRYTDGMPDDLIDDVIDSINTEYELQRVLMQNSDRDYLEYLIRRLTPDRLKIAEAMVFCIEHSDWYEEITECLAESLTNKSTSLPRKIARLYLVSDILQNCDTKIYTAYYYR